MLLPYPVFCRKRETTPFGTGPLKLCLHYSRQTVYSSSKVCISAGYVNRATAIKVVQHCLSASNTALSVSLSAPEYTSTLIPPHRTDATAELEDSADCIMDTSVKHTSCFADMISKTFYDDDNTQIPLFRARGTIPLPSFRSFGKLLPACSTPSACRCDLLLVTRSSLYLPPYTLLESNVLQ